MTIVRNTLVVVAVLIWILAFGEAANAATSHTTTVALSHTALVHASPTTGVVSAVSAYTPITHQQTVLPVISKRDVRHHAWLRVRLPQRPNGSTGWISATGTTERSTPWTVYIDRGTRRAHIYRSGRLERAYSVIVGRPNLPTPVGTFFVTEIFEDRGAVSGPYALATSAYSNVLQEFDGGPGQVALHGREGLSGSLGTASSHGCVRFDTTAITWMAYHLDAGTLVIIH